jgi:hypothetical protein
LLIDAVPFDAHATSGGLFYERIPGRSEGGDGMATAKSWALLGLALSLGCSEAGAEVPPPEEQIAAAVMAAPADRRDGARVLGFTAEGELTTLREAANDLVCLADTPGNESFSVACYHESLGPYMQRGRELRAEGITDAEERLHRRWEEADEGMLDMPMNPATLYVLSGKGFDAAVNEVIDPYLRFVVYIPWATAESTGLPAQPIAPGAPWIMFPGTAGAHIMISPPRPEAPKPEGAEEG